MAGGPEDLIEKSAVGVAKLAGWISYKVSWLGQRGAPDRVFMRKGRCVWIEFKRPGEEPTVQQYRMAERMRDAGLEVHWTDSVEGCMRVLNGR